MSDLPPRSKWVEWVWLIVSFIGLADASYLAFRHYQGLPPPCGLLEGCETVTTSPYSLIAGVPVALLGALYYLAFFLLTFYLLDSGNEKIKLWLARGSVLGFIGSLYFVYLQFFVIEAVCLWCMLSATTSTVLFAVGLYVIYYRHMYFGGH